MNKFMADKGKKDAEKTFTITIDEHGLFILTFFIVPVGKVENISQAKAIEEKTFKIFNQDPNHKFNVMVDAREISNVSYVSHESQQIYMGIMAQNQIQKLAFVGFGRWLKIMTSTFAKLVTKWPETRWFDEIEKAHAWLEEL